MNEIHVNLTFINVNFLKKMLPRFFLQTIDISFFFWYLFSYIMFVLLYNIFILYRIKKFEWTVCGIAVYVKFDTFFFNSVSEIIIFTFDL